MLIKLIAIIVHRLRLTYILTSASTGLLLYLSESSITFMLCLNFPHSLLSSLRDIWWHAFCKGTKNTLSSQPTSKVMWLHLWIMEILRSRTRHNWSVVAPLRQWQRVVVFLLPLLFLLFLNSPIKASDSSNGLWESHGNQMNASF